MIFGKREKKTAHPYAWLAVFSLAAAGVISIGRRSMDFVAEKSKCIKDIVKNKTNFTM